MSQRKIVVLSLSFFLLVGCAQKQDVLLPVSTTSDVPLPVSTTSPEALELFNAGIKHQLNHDFLLQPQYFQKALVLDPDFVLANLWINESDPAKWLEHFEKAKAGIDKVSEAERILVDMAVANVEDRTKDAIKLGEELVQKYPNSSDSYVYLGNAFRGINDFDGAEENYKKALEINPENLRALWQITSHHMNVYNGQVMRPKEEQDRSLAGRYIERMIEISPDAGSFHQMRGNLFRAESDFESAKKWYRDALEIKESQDVPKAGILGVVAHNLLFNGEVEEAHNYYDSSIEASVRPSQKIGQWTFKIQAYLFVDDYHGAIKAADELLSQINDFGFSDSELYQNKRQVEFRKFLAFAHNKEQEKAYDSMMLLKNYRNKQMSSLEYDEIRERNFKILDAQQEAWHYLLFGEYEKANSKLEDLYAIVSKIDNPTAIVNYRAMKGMIHLFSGDAQKALEYLDDTIETENYQYYSYYKALALKATEQDEEASSIFYDLANYNFNSWGASLVRSLSKDQLE